MQLAILGTQFLNTGLDPAASCNITTGPVASCKWIRQKTAMVQAEQDPDLPCLANNVLGEVSFCLTEWRGKGKCRRASQLWGQIAPLRNNVLQPLLHPVLAVTIWRHSSQSITNTCLVCPLFSAKSPLVCVMNVKHCSWWRLSPTFYFKKRLYIPFSHKSLPVPTKKPEVYYKSHTKLQHRSLLFSHKELLPQVWIDLPTIKLPTAFKHLSK